MNMHQKIGDKIRFRRKELGYTLKELAGNRITPAQISAIENGKCNPSSGLLNYLCERMSVDTSYFTLTVEDRYRTLFDEIKVKTENLFDCGNYKESMEEISKMSEGFNYLNEDQKGFFFSCKAKYCMKINNMQKPLIYLLKAFHITLKQLIIIKLLMYI